MSGGPIYERRPVKHSYKMQFWQANGRPFLYWLSS